MTNTAAASRTIARIAIIVLGAIAFLLGLGAISEAQAATPTEVQAQQVRTIVVVPELATIETTPVICRIEQGPADGAFRWETCTPEESPRGGYVTVIFEDGSASYSDGYTISVADEDNIPADGGAVVGEWKAPKTDRRAQNA